jgi:hypothetical protein
MAILPLGRKPSPAKKSKNSDALYHSEFLKD